MFLIYPSLIRVCLKIDLGTSINSKGNFLSCVCVCVILKKKHLPSKIKHIRYVFYVSFQRTFIELLITIIVNVN